jgi:hypothetical protein
MTVFYGVVVDVIHVTLVIPLIADDMFPKASLPDVTFCLPQTPRSLPEGGMRCAFPPYRNLSDQVIFKSDKLA